ncbi:hypothetical protein D5086_000054 [Populus alba]|uniref:Uncharacterized protein n=3 Tax=Populus TaxID=3689 RepID=A0ACC4CVI9_POPAL|nr:hypothetical protein NC653_000191 [Populus alba x Populus x berolinensis]TKS01619.1 hypothetical protein D5086_0000171030 [Populus alba]
MNSTGPFFRGPASAGQEEEGPLSFLASPTPSSATDLHLPPHEYCSNGTVTKKKKKKTEMQKKKRQETDRRYRQKKKKAVQDTEEKLAIAIAENGRLKAAVEKLRRENAYFKKQRFATIYAEFSDCLLNDPITTNI